MRNLKKKRRIQVIGLSGVCLIVATAIIGFGLRDGIQFFKTPTDVISKPPAANETFRIGGMVEYGSLKRSGTLVTFKISDGQNIVPVTYSGIVPDLFKEGEGTIATGKLADGTFQATEILAKHDETYMPAELAEMNLEK
jgi:cytochrome c-type biogenesis protein CcmE